MPIYTSSYITGPPILWWTYFKGWNCGALLSAIKLSDCQAFFLIMFVTLSVYGTLWWYRCTENYYDTLLYIMKAKQYIRMVRSIFVLLLLENRDHNLVIFFRSSAISLNLTSQKISVRRTIAFNEGRNHWCYTVKMRNWHNYLIEILVELTCSSNMINYY